MKNYLRSHESGDTIVEVLISIAIVSLILAISYGTASHNARDIQDAQERSQAIQIAQSQIELLKANNGLLEGDGMTVGDCFAGGSAVQSGQTGDLTLIPHDGNDPCVVESNGTQAPANFEPAYKVQISQDATSKTFAVAITWESLISTGHDNLTMYYRP